MTAEKKTVRQLDDEIAEALLDARIEKAVAAHPELADQAHRLLELRFHLIETAIAPQHPASRANRARWEREYQRLKRRFEALLGGAS